MPFETRTHFCGECSVFWNAFSARFRLYQFPQLVKRPALATIFVSVPFRFWVILSGDDDDFCMRELAVVKHALVSWRCLVRWLHSDLGDEFVVFTAGFSAFLRSRLWPRPANALRGCCHRLPPSALWGGIQERRNYRCASVQTATNLPYISLCENQSAPSQRREKLWRLWNFLE